MSYGTIRLPIHLCSTHEGIIAKVKKACQHIHGRAFVVNKINDLPGIENDLFIQFLLNDWLGGFLCVFIWSNWYYFFCQEKYCYYYYCA